MTFWEFLAKCGPGWPSTRGWYALGLFAQTFAILVMVVAQPQLRADEFFKTLATAIVITGWIGLAVGGRDNRADLDRLGKAQDLAVNLIEHIRSKDPADPFVNAPRGDAAGSAEQ